MGYDVDSVKGQAVLKTDRMNDALRTTKSVAGEAFTGLLTDLRRGTDLATSLSNLIGRIADRFIGGAVDSVISAAFAGEGKGGGGWVSSVLASIKSSVGYADGGYTGPGGRYDVAGFVHRGEVVFSAADVARHGGGAAVDALRRSGGLRGYAEGGIVGREAFTMPRDVARNMGGITPQVVFSPNIITPPGYEARTREVPDGRGGRRQEIVIAEAVAAGIRSPQGRQALGQRQVAQR